MIPNMQQNPNLAMFAQMAQPQGTPPMGGPSPKPAQPGAMQPPMGGPQNVMQQAAAKGQGGDTILAHLTPGEIAVPPQVQTPQVLAILGQAFQQNKIDPAQFTAGSPRASVNPQTGMEQFNFLSSFLPAALGIAGGVLAPELLPAMAPALAGAIGGGVGTAAGGLASGQSPLQAGLSGLGAGAGGYFLGGLMPGADAAAKAGVAPGAASEAASAAADATAGFPGYTMGQAGASPIMGSQMLGNAVHNFNPLAAAGSALGGSLGSSLGAPPPKSATGPQLPPGFTNHLTPVSQLPSYTTQLGYGTYKGPSPTFSNYNPATNNPAAYNFFPS